MTNYYEIMKAIVFAGCLMGFACTGEELFPEPIVQTAVDGCAVVRFGTVSMLSGAPWLWNDVTFQKGNGNPREKFPLKTSREIKGGYIGVNTTRTPAEESFYPRYSEPVHLIDGNLDSSWMSEGQPRGDCQPIVIRLDLVAERDVNRIVLDKRRRKKQYWRRNCDANCTVDAVEVGRGVPLAMKVEVATDAYRWQEVFNGQTNDDREKDFVEIRFPARRVKQVLITATRLQMVENAMYAVSFSGLSVFGTDNVDYARIDRGGTVTVNSTRHQEEPLMSQHRLLWPVQWHLGAKWARVGYHDDPFNWHNAERKKGEFRIDPVCDASITALKENGLKIIMCLNFGNRLYSGPEKRSFPFLPEWYWNKPKPPTTEEALKGWDRYVEFMCAHFKDRVEYFEIWNEWNIPSYWGDKPDTEAFCRIVERTIPLLRKHAPGVKVMLGSTSGGFAGISKWTPERLAREEKENPRFIAWKRYASQVDAIGYHPFYNPQRWVLLNYSDDIRAFGRWLKAQGFRGVLHASEWSINARYPAIDEKDVKNVWCGTYSPSEFHKAKETVRQMTRHAAFGIPSCFFETYQAFYTHTELYQLKTSLLQDPVAMLHPSAAYYALRNLATILDGFEPADLGAKLADTRRPVNEAFGFSDGKRRAVAVWYENDVHEDGYRQVPSAVTLPFVVDGEIFGYDPINGVRQKLNSVIVDSHTEIRDLLVGDVPLVIMF